MCPMTTRVKTPWCEFQRDLNDANQSIYQRDYQIRGAYRCVENLNRIVFRICNNEIGIGQDRFINDGLQPLFRCR